LIATLQDEIKGFKENRFAFFFFKFIGLVERKETKIAELTKMVALAETRNTIGFEEKQLVVQQKSYASIGEYVEKRSLESMFKATMLMPFTFFNLFANTSRTAEAVKNLRNAEAAIEQAAQAIKAIKA